MPAHHSLARARRWVPQTPGRVDRLVRKTRATHHTCTMAEALAKWMAKHGVRPGDPVTYKIRPSLWGVGSYGIDPVYEWLKQYRKETDEEVRAREAAATARAAEQYWSFGRLDLSRFARFNRLDLTTVGASVADRPYNWPRTPPIEPPATRWGWENAYLGFAWPPAGNESKPPPWPSPAADTNKNRSTNMAKPATWPTGPDERSSDPEDEALRVARFADQQERAALLVMDEATAFLMRSIHTAEKLGLTVDVRQKFDTVPVAGEVLPQRRTTSLAVSITKRLR